MLDFGADSTAILRAAMFMTVDFLGAKRDALHASLEALSLGTKERHATERRIFGFAQSRRYAAVTGMETDQ
jgi:hypothetical protein